MEKNCLMLVSHYRPLIGGALTVYDALGRYSERRISILTASRDYWKDQEVPGWLDFDRAAPYKVSRIPEMRTPMMMGAPGLVRRIVNYLRQRKIDHSILQAVDRLVEEDAIDVICVCTLDSNGALIPALKKRTGKKVILYVHGEEVAQQAHSERAEKNRESLLHQADAIVTVSKFTSDVLQQKYSLPKDRIYLQTNGVDTNLFDGHAGERQRTEYGLPASPFVFSCGRLVERKGFDRLVEAWPLVLEKVPEAKLVIGGDGPLKAVLQRQIDEKKLAASVSLRGWLSDRQLVACFGLADLFVMPNREMPDGDNEGFGLEFIEAGAMGTPSVGGRAGGVVEAIQDGETGLLVDGNDPADIANAIIKLLSDPVLCQQLAQAAKAFARQNDWQKKAIEFQKFLKSV